VNPAFIPNPMDLEECLPYWKYWMKLKEPQTSIRKINGKTKIFFGGKGKLFMKNMKKYSLRN